MSSFSKRVFLNFDRLPKTMEPNHIHSHHQTQPQLKVPSTSQTAHITTPLLVYHDPAAPCIVGEPVNEANSGSTAPILAYHDPAAPCIVDEPMNEGNNGSNFIDHKAFFDSLPPGYRFRPTKEELIKNYLLPKIEGKILPPSHIRDANLYEDCPDKITERYEADEEEWYFFTPRDRKYPKGNRPNRAAGDGYWKATGADIKIFDNDDKVGFKKSLVYFVGKPPNGEKTNWIMHEYRAADGNDKPKENPTSMRLDDYVLCRIYKKNDQSLKGHSREAEFQVGTPSTPVKNCNNINARESVSSRLMNSQEATLLMDASNDHDDKFSSNFLVKEVTPLNYGYNYGYELLYSYGNKEEFEDISSLDLDNFLVQPIDDHLPFPHAP